MKDFSGGDTENSTMKAGKTNMGRLSKVEISGVNTSKLPVLSREEAKVLFQQARAGSEEARQTLIQGNLRLVLSVIKKFDGRNENPDDLFQVGCVGLIKGIDNFNVDLDVFPSTYLVPMIVGEGRGPVFVPRHLFCLKGQRAVVQRRRKIRRGAPRFPSTLCAGVLY